MVKVDFNDLEFEKLNEHHTISSFDCEHRDITNFLLDDSHYQMSHKMNVTHVCIYNSRVVAYFTWCADSVRVKNLEDDHKQELEDLGIDYKYLPAIKLCRLGVDKNFKGNHIGHYLVETVIQNSYNMSKKVGIRYVSVDAYVSAKWLYDKYNFKLFPKEENRLEKFLSRPHPNQSVAMYRDIR